MKDLFRQNNSSVGARLLILASALGLTAAGCGGVEQTPYSPWAGGKGEQRASDLAEPLAAVLRQDAVQYINFSVLGCQVDGSSLAMVAQFLHDGRVKVSTELPVAGHAGYAPELDTFYWPQAGVCSGNAQNVVHEAVHVLQDYNYLSVTSAQSEVPAHLAQLLYEIGRQAGSDLASAQRYLAALQDRYATLTGSFEQIISAALAVIQNNQALLTGENVSLFEPDVEGLLAAINQIYSNDWVPTNGIDG